MRIADIDHRRRIEDRPIGRPDLKRDRPGVVESLLERDLVPAETRGSHIDGDHAAAVAAAAQQPAQRLDRHRRFAAFAKDEVGNAARGIAAALHLVAIAVPDPHADIGGLRGCHDDELVAADPRATVGDPSHLIARHVERRFAAVKHHEIIAKPVHLPERHACERGHERHIGAKPSRLPVRRR
jgi:hypothetical protein